MIPPLTSSEPLAIVPYAERLRDALAALLQDIPDAGGRPSALARVLDVNRVIISKLLSALKRPDPLEVLQYIPGPDSLRAIADAADRIPAVPDETVRDAREAIDAFAALIRDNFGTRGALDAAISDANDDLRKRYEEAARTDIFNGMRHVIGVEGETWITTMIFAPNPDDPDHFAVTTLHGTIAMRRLRPDAPVCFTFGPPYKAPDVEPDPLASPIGLQEFYTHQPAPLQTEVHNGQLVHRLAKSGVGKDALVDMLAVSHDPRGCRRYASPDRPLGGVALFHDAPVRMLHCDAILHKSAFPDTDPDLLVYNPGSRGPANPNDPARDLDRIAPTESIEPRRYNPDRFEAPTIPNYDKMLARIFKEIDQPQDDYRVYRLRIPYPILGFQYVLAFQAPPRP